MPLLLTGSRGDRLLSRGLLGLTILIVGGLAFASSALAVPKAPELGGTYPASPGVSTTPRVFGWVSEIIVSRLGGLRGPVARAGAGENEEIEIYATPTCSGPVVATGTASELENSGVQVSVGVGTTTAFSATNSDSSGISACSNSIEYRQVSDPPATPSVTGVDPASPADDNLPHVIGTAEDGATVSIYANPSCSGEPLGSGAASLFEGAGIQVNVPDNSITSFYAKASWGELPSSCSSSTATYQEVSAVAPGPGGGDDGGGGAGPTPTGGGPPAPHATPAKPRLHTVPGGISNDSQPLVVGSAPGAIRVQIYKNAACGGHPAAAVSAAQFADGVPIVVTANATTHFYGEAIAADGTVSDCSDSVSYVEDSSPPLTRITFGPGVKTRKRLAVFRFTDITEDLPGTTFLCKFDRGPWGACQAPLKLPHLRPKVHTLRVKAIDVAGNEEAVGASRRFKVVRGA
jgi:hypothetical protein